MWKCLLGESCKFYNEKSIITRKVLYKDTRKQFAKKTVVFFFFKICPKIKKMFI